MEKKTDEYTIFEDDDLIALNKPSGLLSIPDREGKEVSLKVLLQEKYDKIYTVHRLDKETSGLILFAKNETTHAYLSQQFEQRQTEKIYVGLVLGSLLNKDGTIDSRVMEHPVKKGLMVINRKGKEAITNYEVLRDFGIYSWLKFQIHTGRTHQIRIHMKDMGHPIICDPLYGDGTPLLLSAIKKKFKLSKNEEEERPILKRLALHAFRLKFKDNNGKVVTLEAAIPKDMRAVLQQLEKRMNK